MTMGKETTGGEGDWLYFDPRNGVNTLLKLWVFGGWGVLCIWFWEGS